MATENLPNISTISGACPTYPDGAENYTPANDIDTFSSPAFVCLGGSGGNIVVRPANGAVAVTFTGLPVGYVLPFRVAGINLTGTTATGLVVIF
jgi:hypothetical protein